MTARDRSLANGHRLQIVIPLVDLQPGARLVLDMRAATFLDSSGIRLILQAHQLAARHGARLVVVRGPECVMRPLELVALDQQLDLVARI
jgi:anti-anti-sigma factor